MNPISPSIPRTLIWLPSALLALSSLGLCFVPLFNLLGYEFCFALGLFSVPTAAMVGIGTARESEPRFLHTALLVLLHLLPGLLIITLNGMRIKNCDYPEGLLLFIALPVCSALYAGTLGHAAALADFRYRLVLLAALLFFPLGAQLFRLYTQPQIFVFDHLWGYFAGSLYDETVTLDHRALCWRLGTALNTALAIGAFTVARRWGLRLWSLIGFLTIGGLYDELVGPLAGFRLDRRDTEKHLSQVVTRPGLRVHLPPDTEPQTAERIADFHLFWIEQLKQTLGVTGPETIHSYVYKDRQQKAALMGGRRTMVAKPWLGEIHVHGLQVPHRVVPHELVHVLAAELGRPPFGITMRYGFKIDLGIVEGLAEALTPARGDYELHHWVRALRAIGRAPDVRDLVAVTDFWRAPPARAYAVMGSFIRYLLETRGAAPIRDLYRSGDFEGALDEKLDAVVSEWESFVDGLELSEQQKRAAEERFRRSSIFGRVCAHEIAQLRENARHANPKDAIHHYTAIADFLDDAPNARFDVALAHFNARNFETFRAQATELVAEAELNSWRTTQLREYLGRLEWQNGEVEAAKTQFRLALENPRTVGHERLQWVRLWALDRASDERHFLRKFLEGELNYTSAIDVLRRLSRKSPGDPTLSYLLARQLLQVGSRTDAALVLREVPHPFVPIEVERLRLLASIQEQNGQYADAAHLYRQGAELSSTTGQAAQWKAHAAWLDWLARRSTNAP